MQKLVTVVVPVYGVEKYLDRCIRSIVRQTYQNLEIILVDDGSPDRCPEMCDQWAAKDERIRVIHKENAGLGMARNTGIENASGDYICFFDSDDYVDEAVVEKAAALAQKENAEIVLYGMKNVNREGMTVAEYVPETEKTVFAGAEVQERLLPDVIEGGRIGARNRNLPLSAWSCVFSMELIRQTGWRFVSERENISEDSYSLIWLYRYIQRAAVLPEALYFYCENDTSLTRSYRPDRYDRCRQFYLDTVAMVQRQGYPDEVCRRIAGLFFGFVIGAMKQIAAADIGRREQKKQIGRIVKDGVMQEALDRTACRYESRNKNILRMVMQLKLTKAVWLLVRSQAARRK